MDISSEYMEQELLRKILEKLESIDENLERISDKLNKPLKIIPSEAIVNKPNVVKPFENIQNVVYTPKKDR